MRSAMRLANEIGDAPVMVLLCATAKGPQAAGSVIPAAQNMLLAARAFGIGGTIATLHAVVEERVHELFGIPDTAQVVYCMPFGYPRGNFGPVDAAAVERGMQLRPVGSAAGLEGFRKVIFRIRICRILGFSGLGKSYHLD